MIISDLVDCNKNDLSEENTEQSDEEYKLMHNPTYKEVWKTINTLKIKKMR